MALNRDDLQMMVASMNDARRMMSLNQPVSYTSVRGLIKTIQLLAQDAYEAGQESS